MSHWTKRNDPTQQGNFSRFVQTRPFIASGQRGVDFPESINSASPWALTTKNAIDILTVARNDP